MFGKIEGVKMIINYTSNIDSLEIISKIRSAAEASSFELSLPCSSFEDSTFASLNLEKCLLLQRVLQEHITKVQGLVKAEELQELAVVPEIGLLSQKLKDTLYYLTSPYTDPPK